MVKLKAKDFIRAALLGGIVMVATAPVLGVINSVLGMIPSVDVLGISAPHGLLAAGIVVIVADLLLEKVKALR